MGCGCGPWETCTGKIYNENWEYCVNCGERRLKDEDNDMRENNTATPTDDIVEQSPDQKKVPKLRHGMNIKIGNELFKVYRASKKSVTLRYQGDA